MESGAPLGAYRVIDGLLKCQLPVIVGELYFFFILPFSHPFYRGCLFELDGSLFVNPCVAEESAVAGGINMVGIGI